MKIYHNIHTKQQTNKCKNLMQNIHTNNYFNGHIYATFSHIANVIGTKTLMYMYASKTDIFSLWKCLYLT